VRDGPDIRFYIDGVLDSEFIGVVDGCYYNQFSPDLFYVVGVEEQSIVSWNVNLTFSAFSSIYDTVIFGEASGASDGQDSYDVPKAGLPPTPYLYAWFDAGLGIPYDKLWYDYRDYPDNYEVWNISVIWAPSDYVTPTDVVVSWDTDAINDSGYDSVFLCNETGVPLVDMRSNSIYIYNSSAMMPHNFQIVCSIQPVENYHIVPMMEGWNILSLPSDVSVDKADIVVNFSGVNYSWQEAVDGDVVLGFIYDWNESVQSYGFTDVLMAGQGYWVYAYSACDLWMSVSENSDDLISGLLTDWNLIGLPFVNSVVKDNLSLNYSGADHSWLDAVDDGFVIDFIYDWNESGQSYEFTDVLIPGGGYWIYAYYDSILKR